MIRGRRALLLLLLAASLIPAGHPSAADRDPGRVPCIGWYADTLAAMAAAARAPEARPAADYVY